MIRSKIGYARATIIVTSSVSAWVVGAIRAAETRIACTAVIVEEMAKVFRDNADPKVLTHR
jgi:hypothetical protein